MIEVHFNLLWLGSAVLSQAMFFFFIQIGMRVYNVGPHSFNIYTYKMMETLMQKRTI